MPYQFLNLKKPQDSDNKVPSNDSGGTDLAPTEVSTAFNIDSFSDDHKDQIRQLFRDLKWLISEGYVTEYSNGTLFVQQKIIENKKTSETGEVMADNNKKTKSYEAQESSSDESLNEVIKPDAEAIESDHSEKDAHIAGETASNESSPQMIDSNEPSPQD